MAKKTQQRYITEVIEIHKGLYTYKNLVYVGSSPGQKLIVTCSTHGDFEINAACHRRGKGCQKCAYTARAQTHKHTFKDFLEIAEPRNGHQYVYIEPSTYFGENTIISAICTKHGLFSTTAVQHKMGRGCGKCGSEAGWAKMFDTQEEFIAKSIARHGDRYDYSLVKYKNDKEDVEIICKEHKSFWQTPQNHKAGRGCPACASYGFDRTKPATLYILQFNDVVKVGITNRPTKQRVSRINKDSGYKFTIHTEIKSESGLKICNLESSLLKWLRSNYEKIADKFEGSTECFLNVPIEAILHFIMPHTRENLIEP